MTDTLDDLETEDLETSTSRTIAGPDCTIHYHDVGEGPPLVMIQAYGALPGSSAWLTYGKLIEDLSATNRCLLVDMPNYGKTGPLIYNEPVHDVYARTVIAVMDHVGIDKCPVIGLSIGGTTGLVLALDYPDRVERLVVGSCHASTGGDPYVLTPFPSEVGKLHRESVNSPADPEKIKRLLTALWHDPALASDELVEYMMAQRAEHADHLDASRASVSVNKSHMFEMRQIAHPIMIIHGRFDRMVPLEQALAITSFIPQANLVVLNSCGHWPPFEQPAAYLAHLRAFLAA